MNNYLSPEQISKELLKVLKSNGADFFISVPCKLLKEIILLLEKDKTITYLPVTREEEGVGVAVGAYLAGKTPVILMQNSGVGNSINAIASLANYYSIPLLFLISHRGTQGEKIAAQFPMGKAVPQLLKTIKMSISKFDQANQESFVQIGKIVKKIKKQKCSSAILLPFSFWRE